MREASTIHDARQPAAIPWALQIGAISRDEPGRVAKTVTVAVLGSGGWVLSRSVTDSGLIDILFEFERPSCVEIYSVLIAAGLELSRSAHVRFTELCQCTRLGRSNSSEDIVSVDLEIQTIPWGAAKGQTE